MPLPLLVYCIVYATQQDQVVVLRLGSPPVESVAWTPDPSHWWNGSTWRPIAEELPFQAPVSADGGHFWDGQGWRPIPPTATVPQRPAGPAWQGPAGPAGPAGQAGPAGAWQMPPGPGAGPVPPPAAPGAEPGAGLWAKPDSPQAG